MSPNFCPTPYNQDGPTDHGKTHAGLAACFEHATACPEQAARTTNWAPPNDSCKFNSYVMRAVLKEFLAVEGNLYVRDRVNHSTDPLTWIVPRDVESYLCDCMSYYGYGRIRFYNTEGHSIELVGERASSCTGTLHIACIEKSWNFIPESAVATYRQSVLQLQDDLSVAVALSLLEDQEIVVAEAAFRADQSVCDELFALSLVDVV
jgi:hypothetical protein